MGLPKFFDNWAGRAANVYALWPLLPGGVVGVITGWLASGVSWINQFGPFGWWAAGVLGFFVSGLSFMSFAVAREKWGNAKATQEWVRKVDNINPMKGNFDRERISIRDIAHPINHRIKGKTFTNCELIGPENIIFFGRGSANGVGFMNCDIIVVKENVKIQNIKVFEDCHIIGGVIWNCTVFMPQEFFDRAKAEMQQLEAITYERN